MLTARRKEICEYYALNPYTSYSKLSEMFNMTPKCICQMMKDPECKAYINQVADEAWADYRVNAMTTMKKLAERGNIRALEFLLKTNGMNPETKVAVSTEDAINIAIKKDEN